jgi:UDP-N-acetylglucosamine 2-epimerase (non-hydrolysing)
MVGLEINRICQALDILISKSYNGKQKLKIVDDYNVNNVSEKVLRIILSYTDFVNRVVWRK